MGKTFKPPLQPDTWTHTPTLTPGKEQLATPSPPTSGAIKGTCSFASSWGCCSILSHFSQFFVTLWTTAHQAALSMGCFRQEYWSGLSSKNLTEFLDRPLINFYWLGKAKKFGSYQCYSPSALYQHCQPSQPLLTLFATTVSCCVKIYPIQTGYFHGKRDNFPNRFLYFCWPLFSTVMWNIHSSSYQFCGCLGGGLNWYIEKPCDYSYLTMHFILSGFRRICFFFLNLPFSTSLILEHWWFYHLFRHPSWKPKWPLPSFSCFPSQPPHNDASKLTLKTLPIMTSMSLIIFSLGYYTPVSNLSAFSLTPSPPNHPMVPQIHTHTQNYFENSKKKKITSQISEKITIFAGLDPRFQRSQARCLNKDSRAKLSRFQSQLCQILT